MDQALYHFIMESPPSQNAPNNLAASRILAVTEEELQRIILDIHDGPVQSLFAALTQINLMQKRRTRGNAVSLEECDQLFSRLNILMETALGEIRHFLGTFRPPDFARRELADIIQGLLLHHEMTTGSEVDYQSTSKPISTSMPVRIALYRFCQEALSNAYRHAQADKQWIRLDKTDGHIVLEVGDDGKGFNPPPLSGPEATEQEEHIGLRGMRDRIALVGGQFELFSEPGKGTRIVVKVPVDE
jgi:signal transduction histidine kinase